MISLLKKTELNIEEAVPSLSQSYVKHNQKREEILRLGNEKQSPDVIEGFGDEDEEDEKFRALKESFSQLMREEMAEKKVNETEKKESVIIEAKIEKLMQATPLDSESDDDGFEIILPSPKNCNS